MKKLLFICIAIIFSCSAWSQDMSVMTFNLRLATGKDAPYHWQARTDAVAYCLKKEKPALLGVQEALHVQIEFLDSLLTGYKREGVGRDDGKTGGEYSAIYYDARRFKLLDGGTFWLSETPSKVSMGWDAACRRVVSWVKLKDLKSDREFCYMNTHF
ncbi:MAG: endonuclease, partial [Rikenellaceae bacterium]